MAYHIQLHAVITLAQQTGTTQTLLYRVGLCWLFIITSLSHTVSLQIRLRARYVTLCYVQLYKFVPAMEGACAGNSCCLLLESIT
jgi:hypothetical protein